MHTNRCPWTEPMKVPELPPVFFRGFDAEHSPVRDNLTVPVSGQMHTNICPTCHRTFETSDPNEIYCSMQCEG